MKNKQILDQNNAQFDENTWGSSMDFQINLETQDNFSTDRALKILFSIAILFCLFLFEYLIKKIKIFVSFHFK